MIVSIDWKEDLCFGMAYAKKFVCFGFKELFEVDPLS